MYAEDKTTIADRREMLRVKIKSLSEEARIIRREEQRTFGGLRSELHLHRVGIVRSEARVAHLAYGFIRGLTLDQMEEKSETPPNWDRVRTLMKRYGPKEFVNPEVPHRVWIKTFTKVPRITSAAA